MVILKLSLRSRVETSPGSGRWNEVVRVQAFSAGEAAILICDMWDRHWCRSATRRCVAITSISFGNVAQPSAVLMARSGGPRSMHDAVGAARAIRPRRSTSWRSYCSGVVSSPDSFVPYARPTRSGGRWATSASSRASSVHWRGCA